MRNECGLLEDMAKNCFYALGGINYKNGVITVCPRQADQAVAETSREIESVGGEIEIGEPEDGVTESVE